MPASQDFHAIQISCRQRGQTISQMQLGSPRLICCVDVLATLLLSAQAGIAVAQGGAGVGRSTHVRPPLTGPGYDPSNRRPSLQTKTCSPAGGKARAGVKDWPCQMTPRPRTWPGLLQSQARFFMETWCGRESKVYIPCDMTYIQAPLSNQASAVLNPMQH